MGGAPAELPVQLRWRGGEARLLTVVSGRVNRAIRSVLADEGLSVDEWSVLDHLTGAGPCPMSTLATATGTTAATLTRIVDRLVSRALIYRNADSGDRRRVLVHVSDRGRDVADGLRPGVRSAEERAVAELSAEERAGLARLGQVTPAPQAGH